MSRVRRVGKVVVLAAIVVAGFITLRKLIYEPFHWEPSLLGKLPRESLLGGEDRMAVARFTEVSPIFSSSVGVEALRLAPLWEEGAARGPQGDGGHAATVTLGRWGLAVHVMPALLVPDGTSLAYQVEVPDAGVIATYVAAWFPKGVTAREMKFKMDVLSKGQSTTILEQTGPVRRSPDRDWFHRTLYRIEHGLFRGARPKRWIFERAEADLSRWAGQSVVVRLSVDGGGGEPGAGIGLWGLPTLYGAPPGGRESRLNLLLLVADGVSPEFTDCLQDRPWAHTPSISTLCRENRVLERAYAPANGTRGSMASLFYHSTVRDLLLPMRDRSIPDRARAVRAAGPPSMFELLRREGYRTAAIGDNIFSVETHEAGFDLGIEENYLVNGTMQDTPNIVNLGENWIRLHQSVPFALYLHLDMTHDLEKVPPLRDMASILIHAPRAMRRAFRYAAGTHYADRVVGRFMRLLREAGLDRRTMVVVMSDHGNVFSREKDAWFHFAINGVWQWKRSWKYHGASPYEDEIRSLWVEYDPRFNRDFPPYAWTFDSVASLGDRLLWNLAGLGTDKLAEAGWRPDPTVGVAGAGRCVTVELQQGDATVCEDGVKYVKYKAGSRIREGGKERPLTEEFRRIGTDFREDLFDPDPAIRARMVAARTGLRSELPKGWVLRIPAGRSINGRLTMERLPTLIVADHEFGCEASRTERGLYLRAATVSTWCEIYVEPVDQEIRIELYEEGTPPALALGPLGLRANERDRFDGTRDLPGLLAPHGLGAVNMVGSPTLYITDRRTWAYAEPPLSFTRLTPEIAQIMRDWGYLK